MMPLKTRLTWQGQGLLPQTFPLFSALQVQRQSATEPDFTDVHGSGFALDHFRFVHLD